jgi:alcohol dehydrogenase
MNEGINYFFMPPVNLMGIDSAQKIGEYVKDLKGKKALIVTDKSMVKTGIPDSIKKSIEEFQVEVLIWDGTSPNPTDKNVQEGFEFFIKNNCDIIVSVGGGSPHDCAKGIRLLIDNDGNIRDYEGLNKSSKSVTPLIAVNTTSGSAAEITRFCIITDTDRHIKMAIVDWRCTPDVSINDPILTEKMPPPLTAATGMDALTHSVESYVSTIATPVTDCLALKAMELINNWLRVAVSDGKNVEARSSMVYAQLLAGMAFNNASLGYVHAMAHQLGGFYDLPHGVCNAILLPHVIEFNLTSNPKRFADIATALGEDVKGLSDLEAGKKSVEAIKKLSRDIGIPKGLKELGVKEEDIRIMSENAMKDACAATNPKEATLEDIINIYKKAL